MRLRALPTALSFLAPVGEAWARAGGGHSYSGGGHGSSGGGGSGGGGGGGSDLVWLVFQVLRGLFFLTLNYPLIGIPVDLLVIYLIYRFSSQWNASGDVGLSIGASAAGPSRRAEGVFRARTLLRKLRERDPNFSIALFQDFVFALFARVHEARGANRLAELSIFLAPETVEKLRQLSPGLKSVAGVVVGSATPLVVEGVSPPADRIRVVFAFEANYTETLADGTTRSWYANERWTFARKAGVLSREPSALARISCPSCGAPPAKDVNGACPNCGKVIVPGDWDWVVEDVESSRAGKPPLLTADVTEVGTDLPTLTDPDLRSSLERLKASGFDFAKFEERARLCFRMIQSAWTNRDLSGARPFETDSVFETHAYWIQEYRRQNLVNVLRSVRVRGVTLAKIEEDRFYDSVTVRIRAAMIDFTQTVDGRRVCGSPNVPREFTEYWTFIRGRVPKPRKGDALSCPACGAPLKISMTGFCEYCAAKVTSGEFDWVLSAIEQDEAYVG